MNEDEIDKIDNIADLDDEEYNKIIAEYERRFKEDDEAYEQDEFRDLGSGIDALDRTFLFDKRAEELVGVFNDAISFMEQHTDLSREEIIDRVNSKIREIELVYGYEDNPNGIGFVDNVFLLLSINENELKQDPKTIYEFIRHEMTHMLSGELVKNFWQKRAILVSGYSREDVFDFSTKEPNKENEAFNEAVVEMFGYQDEEYREVDCYGYKLYTNQDYNGGYYAINSNIIRQMMLAKGIDRDILFKGLYDRKTAHRVEKKFKKKYFKQLSKNMEDISEGTSEYSDIDYEIDYEKENDPENERLKKDAEAKKHELIEKIKESERIVIDKILMPSLNKLSPEKREELLAEYDKFLVCERDYFRQRTGYQAITIPNKLTKSNGEWLQKVDVDIQEVLDKQEMSKGTEIDNKKTYEQNQK